MFREGGSCPVNGFQVNEYTIRIIAAEVLIVSSVALITQNAFIAVALSFDFAFRAFGFQQLSPLKRVAVWLVETLNLGVKPTNEAPKQFAARLGFVFATILSLMLLLELKIPVFVLGGSLVFFATLESVFAFCVGCVCYNWLNSLRS